LKRSTAGTQIQSREQPDPGLGAGAKPEIGRDAAMEDRDRIAEMIDGADMLFITAGMGGGTGTGAAPVIADIAKSLNILTVAVVTRPFSFEASASAWRKSGIEELGRRSTRLIIIRTNKLMEVLGEDVSLLDAYAAPTTCCTARCRGSPRSSTTPASSTWTSRRAHGDGEVGDADDGLGHAAGVERARAAAQAAVKSPPARGRQPARRARRAGQHHRLGGPQDARVPRGDEHDQGVHRRGRDGHRRHRDREAMEDRLR